MIIILFFGLKLDNEQREYICDDLTAKGKNDREIGTTSKFEVL